jgi:RHS repeat-associated protein
MDDVKRIALVETLTVDNGSPVTKTPVLRYQLGNNIESAALELDENANIISYEEYYPYGDTSYQAGRSTSEVSQKRYRYTGKEKDDESGFYYHGARYYACWLGRWTAVDPAGLVDGGNLYIYCSCNPINFRDPSGLIDVSVNKYAEMFPGATTVAGGGTVTWGDTSFRFPVTDENYCQARKDWYIDDSKFVDAFGIGDQKLVVYEDKGSGNVSIRANFNFTGDGVNAELEGRTYKDLFLDGIKEHWTGTFKNNETSTTYETLTHVGESSKGIKVNMENKQGISNMRPGLFGWSKKNPGSITMYTGDSRSKKDPSYYQTHYDPCSYKYVAAHEFGHALGVGDAYNSKNNTDVTSIYNEFYTKVQDVDIKKVLEAWRSKRGKWQKWD